MSTKTNTKDQENKSTPSTQEGVQAQPTTQGEQVRKLYPNYYFANRLVRILNTDDPDHFAFGINGRTGTIIPFSYTEVDSDLEGEGGRLNYVTDLGEFKERLAALGLSWDTFWSSVRKPLSSEFFSEEQIQAMRMAGDFDNKKSRVILTIAIPRSMVRTITYKDFERQVSSLLSQELAGHIWVRHFEDRYANLDDESETLRTFILRELKHFTETHLNQNMSGDLSYQLHPAGLVSISISELTSKK